MSIAGGVDKALWRGKNVGCNIIQLFTKNANQWHAKTLTPEEIEVFHNAQQQTGIRPVAAHNSYLINLASPDKRLYERSIEALWQELSRAEILGIPYLVMHPGSYVGSGEKEGLNRIVQGINLLYQMAKGMKVMVLLETTAGQGTNLGYRFVHFAKIIEMIEKDEKIGVCFDTCHVFASGYDLSTPTGYEATFEEFHRIIGLDRLKIIHINDSKTPCGTRIDRHEHIGQGAIGSEFFRILLHDTRFKNIPAILETPKGRTAHGENWDAVNLRVLRGLF
jgi:deoxyribonuclease-4